MSSSYGRLVICKDCGDMVGHFRLSGGAVGAAVAASETIDAEDVVLDIGTALHAGNVRWTQGRCWVCVCADTVSAEPWAVRGEEKA